MLKRTITQTLNSNLKREQKRCIKISLLRLMKFDYSTCTKYGENILGLFCSHFTYHLSVRQQLEVMI